MNKFIRYLLMMLLLISLFGFADSEADEAKYILSVKKDDFVTDKNNNCTKKFSPNYTPSYPKNLYPLNDEIVKKLEVNLIWDNGTFDDMLICDVYFAKTAPPLYVATVKNSSYFVSSLEPATTYYWQIVIKDFFGYQIEGPVWKFFTSSYEKMPDSNLNNLIIYPNPYRPNNGLGHKGITFTSLTADAKIEIYTLSGVKVREISNEINGGNTYLWDVTNEETEQLASGVYIYLVTGKNGERKTGKIAVIR